MPPPPHDDYDYATSPIHRVMIVALDDNEETAAYYETSDEDELATLESFFPGYRAFPQSDSNEWGERTKYRIYMCLYAGRTIKIISDGARWGVTFGSMPVESDLEEFIRRLEPTLIRPVE